MAELQDSADLKLQSSNIQQLFKTHISISRQTAEMMAFVAAEIQRSGKHPVVAASLMQLAGQALVANDAVSSGEQPTDSPTQAVLLAAARCQFAVNNQKSAVKLLEIYLQTPRESKSSHSVTNHFNKVETVAKELYSRQMPADARRILGDYQASIFERQYRILSSDGNEPIPVEPPATTGPPVRLPKIITEQDVLSRTDVADRIWVCQLDTVRKTSKILFVLSDCLNAGSPKVSPDGLRIAFDATFPGEAVTSDKKIYIAKLNGTAVRTLGRGTMPSWSPAGERIVCSRYSPQSGVWILQADGTHSHLLDSGGWAGQWSPDGQMIAYTKRETGHQDLAVYDLIEDRFFSVLAERNQSFREIFWNFAWSPNSEQIAFKSDQGVAITNVLKTGTVELIFRENVSFAPNLAWHQATDTIVFAPQYRSLGNERLHYISTTPPSPPVYVEGQMPDRRNSDATWMNDGKTLVYISKPQK